MDIRTGLVVMLLLCLSVAVWGQESWVHTYDPFYESIFTVEDVVIMSDGGYAVNGTCLDTETTIGWGFVIKTDAEGNLLWAKKDTVSFQFENESKAIVKTEDGGIISSSYHYLSGNVLIKRNSDGNREWAYLYNDVSITSMDNTYDNNYIASGYQGVNNISYAMILKISENGGIIWSNNFDFENCLWSASYAIISSNDGGYLLTGKVRYEEAVEAVLVIKTDANGDSLWTRILDVTLLRGRGYTIEETVEGDILVGGRGISEDLTGFLWKLDSEGNTIWLESGIDSCGNSITSLVKSNDGSIISIFKESMYYDNLRKFDSDYNVEWTNPLPYYSGVGDKAVRITSEDNIVVALCNSFESAIGLTKLNPDGTEINEDIIIQTQPVMTAYPNPFNPDINLSFIIENNSNPIVNIFNSKGQRIRKLKIDPASYTYDRIRNVKCKINSVVWDGCDETGKRMASGVYFVQLQTDNKVLDIKKITLIK
ncbi:MAG: T9SS type A sorting domain-containing protein [Candidatus Cloacimonetes bacterium]|nr:T9SS type A sorting domain-containing protein [Candidatus Cloacimonadota bacterium]